LGQTPTHKTKTKRTIKIRNPKKVLKKPKEGEDRKLR
jgi:hypothetical protein